jgi:hypothetical protein
VQLSFGLLSIAKHEEAIENLLDWNGKTDTLRAAQDGGIHSKNLSRLIHQWSAAVTGIDGRIGLQRAMFVFVCRRRYFSK